MKNQTQKAHKCEKIVVWGGSWGCVGGSWSPVAAFPDAKTTFVAGKARTWEVRP